MGWSPIHRALLFVMAAALAACAGDVGVGVSTSPARESGLHEAECGDGDDRACAYAPFDPRHPTISGGPSEPEPDTEPWMPDLRADAGMD